MKSLNPFILIGYQGPEYFCDRERETAKLVSWIENGSNITLMAPRRYGKTGLIHNVFYYLPKSYKCIYLDIYATKNLVEFSKLFVSSVVGAMDTPVEKTISTIAKFFKSCRPTLTPQEDGMLKISFDLVATEAEATLKDAFDYLNSQEGEIVIAIDEFQQILEYPEKGTEALLRSFIQNVPKVRFIFAGSRHHIMGEMFATVKHPFYNSTDMMSLGVISEEKYAEFAANFFTAANRQFKMDVFSALYSRFDGVTWYVQRILNHIWASGAGLDSVETINEAINDLVQDRALVYRDLLESQNETAKMLLRTISKMGIVKHPTSAEFLQSCMLSASSVRSALTELCERELIYKGEDGYIIYDRTFGEWLKSL